LHYIEQISGRLTTGRATRSGAGQGALIGLLFALPFGIFLHGQRVLSMVGELMYVPVGIGEGVLCGLRDQVITRSEVLAVHVA
jgi:hypothetical protein